MERVWLRPVAPIPAFGPAFGPAFAPALQAPSVIFATHPSLRCGDAVHLVRVLGTSARNTLICTGASPKRVVGRGVAAT